MNADYAGQWGDTERRRKLLCGLIGKLLFRFTRDDVETFVNMHAFLFFLSRNRYPGQCPLQMPTSIHHSRWGGERGVWGESEEGEEKDDITSAESESSEDEEGAEQEDQQGASRQQQLEWDDSTLTY